MKPWLNHDFETVDKQFFSAEDIVKAIEADNELVDRLRQWLTKRWLGAGIKLDTTSWESDDASGSSSLTCYLGDNDQLVFDYDSYTRYETARRGATHIAVDHQRYNSQKWIRWRYNDFEEPLYREEMSLNQFVEKYWYEKLFNRLEKILRATAKDSLIGNIEAKLWKVLS
jgi:hypothetical protein